MRMTAGMVLMVALAAVWLGCGCGRDVRLAGKKVRHVQVRPVSHFGLNLDEIATPEQVGFVAMRAIRDEMNASSPAAREAALDVQFDMAAVGAMASRNRTSLTRDEYIHHVVTHWTPTVSHYAWDFPVHFEAARSRLVNRGATKATGDGISETELAMVVHDPGGDPAANVVMRIWLAKDSGMWRVTHFGFEPRRTLTTSRT